MGRYVLSLFTLLFAWNTVNAQAPVQFLLSNYPARPQYKLQQATAKRTKKRFS